MKSIIRKIKYILLRYLVPSNTYIRDVSYCNICEKETTSISTEGFPRDFFKCVKCKASIRENRLLKVLSESYPHWQNLTIHESSPSRRGTSEHLKVLCRNYIGTHYYPNNQKGEIVEGFRNENLENQSFGNDSFDIVISQDVMEHIYEPSKAFKEIARTLKIGGAHIFTIPIVNSNDKSEVWAKLGNNGEPIFLKEPEYHGNPIDKKGSPVTMHWGYDIIDFIRECSGLETKHVLFEEEIKGMKFNIDIFISVKTH